MSGDNGNGTVLILGAASAIARGTALAFAKQGYAILLAGRDTETLDYMARDIALRYRVSARFVAFDATDSASHGVFLQQVLTENGSLSGAVLAFGYLGDQATAIRDPTESQLILEVNFTGAVSILAPLANYFEEQHRGFIIGITSVAGDRGRQSNYTYGAAKGGLNLYLQGLRNRLHPAGVRVITIKPGFVDTAMTFGLQGLFLVADPMTIGAAIAATPQGRRDVLYLPWFWRFIMLIIRSIPEPVFKKLKL